MEIIIEIIGFFIVLFILHNVQRTARELVKLNKKFDEFLKRFEVK